MLSGKMSNEDEDEVEDELEAMAREARGVGVEDMPTAPSVTKDELPDAPKMNPKERIEARRLRDAAGPIAA